MQIFENTLTRRFETEKDLEDITNDIYYSQGQNDLVSLTKSISDPVWDLLDRGGKRIRPVLCNFKFYKFMLDYIIKNIFINVYSIMGEKLIL